jgi:hypothetical protein
MRESDTIALYIAAAILFILANASSSLYHLLTRLDIRPCQVSLKKGGVDVFCCRLGRKTMCFFYTLARKIRTQTSSWFETSFGKEKTSNSSG